MKILALGDVVGLRALDYVEKNLWKLREQYHIDFAVVNGENAREVRGIGADDAKRLLEAGADCVTLGNHAFGQKSIFQLLEDETRVIRPANFPPQTPGSGYTVLNTPHGRILVINVNGRVFMDPLASPYETVERILNREKGNYDLAVMDIHAEATGEKLAVAYSFDGRIQVMFGTHTHIPTADERILPKGSGYITDLGMCGPDNGILGVTKEAVIDKLKTFLPTPFTVADGPIVGMGAVFTLNGQKVTGVERIRF